MRYGATTIVALFAFGSTLTIAAAGSDVRLAPTASVRDALAAMSVPLQAPVGHRQPRVDEAPADRQLSPIELEMRREDAQIDKKLTICRGC